MNGGTGSSPLERRDELVTDEILGHTSVSKTLDSQYIETLTVLQFNHFHVARLHKCAFSMPMICSTAFTFTFHHIYLLRVILGSFNDKWKRQGGRAFLMLNRPRSHWEVCSLGFSIPSSTVSASVGEALKFVLSMRATSYPLHSKNATLDVLLAPDVI